MDQRTFEEWAAKRRLPPGLTLDRRDSLRPYIRRYGLRPLKRHGFSAAMWLLGEYQRGIADALDVPETTASLLREVVERRPSARQVSLMLAVSRG